MALLHSLGYWPDSGGRVLICDGSFELERPLPPLIVAAVNTLKVRSCPWSTGPVLPFPGEQFRLERLPSQRRR